MFLTTNAEVLKVRGDENMAGWVFDDPAKRVGTAGPLTGEVGSGGTAVILLVSGAFSGVR